MAMTPTTRLGRFLAAQQPGVTCNITLPFRVNVEHEQDWTVAIRYAHPGRELEEYVQSAPELDDAITAVLDALGAAAK